MKGVAYDLFRSFEHSCSEKCHVVSFSHRRAPECGAPNQSDSRTGLQLKLEARNTAAGVGGVWGESVKEEPPGKSGGGAAVVHLLSEPK